MILIKAVQFYAEISCRFPMSVLDDPRILKIGSEPSVWRLPMELELSMGPALVSFRCLVFGKEVGTKTVSYRDTSESKPPQLYGGYPVSQQNDQAIFNHVRLNENSKQALLPEIALNGSKGLSPPLQPLGITNSVPSRPLSIAKDTPNQAGPYRNESTSPSIREQSLTHDQTLGDTVTPNSSDESKSGSAASSPRLKLFDLGVMPANRFYASPLQRQWSSSWNSGRLRVELRRGTGQKRVSLGDPTAFIPGREAPLPPAANKRISQESPF